MKILTQTGLTELISKIKSSFIKTTDVIEANVLDIDTTPTQSSNNLITSGGVYTSVSGKEDTSNKVTTITSSSTDTQYPSAKLVYDSLITKQNTITLHILGGDE